MGILQSRIMDWVAMHSSRASFQLRDQIQVSCIVGECLTIWAKREAPRNWFFQTVVLEKTLESPFDNTEIKPINPKGNQPWIFIGRTDPEAEAPVLFPSDEKSQLTGKDPDAGKDWELEDKGLTEGEMVGWSHRLNGHKFEQTQGDGEGQENLACYSPWGLGESDII